MIHLGLFDGGLARRILPKATGAAHIFGLADASGRICSQPAGSPSIGTSSKPPQMSTTPSPSINVPLSRSNSRACRPRHRAAANVPRSPVLLPASSAHDDTRPRPRGYGPRRPTKLQDGMTYGLTSNSAQTSTFTPPFCPHQLDGAQQGSRSLCISRQPCCAGSRHFDVHILAWSDG